MSGHQIGNEFLMGLAGGHLEVADPGTGGTFEVNASHNFVQVTPTGAGETRKLPNPSGFPVGFEFTVICTTNTGNFDLTVGGGVSSPQTQLDLSGSTTAEFTDDGDVIRFVILDREGSRTWNILHNLDSVNLT